MLLSAYLLLVTLRFILARVRLHSNRRLQLLLLISVAAAVPRLYLGATQHLDYDGYVHVFIAMQDNWQIFWQEYQVNSHPLLYYLLLKLMLWFGKSVLVYRSISIITGVVSVFVVGKVAEKVTLQRFSPPIAAIAYGLALPSILISIEVRQYMLCVFFVLASFYYFLDILDGHRHLRSRICFAAFTILAIGSHYCAYFYAFACVVVAGVFGLLSLRGRLLNRALNDLGTFLPIVGVGGVLYYTHAQAHASIHNHLLDFYFQPDRGESLLAFLLRNGQYLFNSFSPFEAPSPNSFIVVLAGLIAAAALTVHLVRPPLPENRRALAMLLLTIVMLVSIILAGIRGWYPFGGYLRQQFILFPFVIIWGSVLLDRLVNAIGDRRLIGPLVAAAVLLIVGASARWFYRFPKDSLDIYADEMNNFRATFPSTPPAIYVDQFNVILFFIYHHDWKWEFSGFSTWPTVQIYRVSKGTQQFLVVRDQGQWNADVRDSALYANLSTLIRSQTLPSITTFCIRQFPEAPDFQKNAALKEQIIASASAAKLCVNEPSWVTTLSAYVQFIDGPCSTK